MLAQDLTCAVPLHADMSESRCRLQSPAPRGVKQSTSSSRSRNDRGRKGSRISDCDGPWTPAQNGHYYAAQSRGSPTSAAKTVAAMMLAPTPGLLWKPEPARPELVPPAPLDTPVLGLVVAMISGRQVVDCSFGPEETVMDVKQKVRLACGLIPEQQKLIWGGVVLQDEQKLGEICLPDHTVLQLLVRDPSEAAVEVKKKKKQSRREEASRRRKLEEFRNELRRQGRTPW
eukprot:CAMPEP_0115054560 /NCGR_PEP_ID=MMETSP0227-20121206/4155_1 /TAXON_ID=89957 /ORGANISM="Polarella glacialis, Strain CCMP 1383" /LENGTH=229 /DNA_ID=CAMNT_0002439035 /DNA_START=6 /DNA_END=695 /DNA_ORIENTATION=-